MNKSGANTIDWLQFVMIGFWIARGAWLTGQAWSASAARLPAIPANLYIRQPASSPSQQLQTPVQEITDKQFLPVEHRRHHLLVPNA